MFRGGGLPSGPTPPIPCIGFKISFFNEFSQARGLVDTYKVVSTQCLMFKMIYKYICHMGGGWRCLQSVRRLTPQGCMFKICNMW